MTLILGLESSCDETAAAVVKDGTEVLSNVVSSQITQHAPFGGVVPELAAREHLKAIQPVTDAALEEAGCKISGIDAIAVTQGPGLMPALLVGLNFAKGLAAGHNLPLIGINHFTAHIYGAFFEIGASELSNPERYPILALVVSGGHTALVLIGKDKQVRVAGTTIDDAAGEALDKAAKLLNLGYPGGPVIEKAAKSGNPKAFNFPRGLTGGGGKPLAPEHRFNFSFSGVKTAMLYHCRNAGGAENLDEQTLYDSVASYQEAVIDVLVKKTVAAAKHFGAATVIMAGGVACNSLLRERLTEKLPKNRNLVISPKKYCTDNAAMVAGLAYHHFQEKDFSGIDIDAYPRLPELTNVPF